MIQPLGVCRGFARDWGCDGITVANLYALRSTDPMYLWKHEDPIGPDNNDFLSRLSYGHRDIVCAWGGNAKPDRVKEFTGLMKQTGARLWCLGTTKSGMPRHPLYIKKDQPLIRWEYK